jgi:hypothetical protein
MKTLVLKDVYARFLLHIFLVAKNSWQKWMPFIVQKLNNIWSFHIVEHYAAIKKNESEVN